MNSFYNPNASLLEMLYRTNNQQNQINQQFNDKQPYQPSVDQNYQQPLPQQQNYSVPNMVPSEPGAAGAYRGFVSQNQQQYSNAGFQPQNVQPQTQTQESNKVPSLQNNYQFQDPGYYNYTIPQAPDEGARMVVEANKQKGDAEANQAEKSYPEYQRMERLNEQYASDLQNTQKKGESDISKSIEQQKADIEAVQNHKFLSKADLLNRMNGTDKLMTAIGSIAGGISQGLLRTNTNPFWQQFDSLAESEIAKNNREYMQAKDKLDNDKSLTETQRNLLIMRVNNLGSANVAQVNAVKSKLDSIAHDQNLPVILRANALERTGQAQMVLDQMHFQNQMLQAQYARDLGPTSERFAPGFGIAINKEAAEKIAPIVQNQRLFNESLNTLFRNRDAAGHPVPGSQYSHEDEIQYKNMLKYAEDLTGIPAKEIEDKIGNPAHFMVQDPNRAYEFLNEFVNRPTVQKIMTLNHGLPAQPMYGQQRK